MITHNFVPPNSINAEKITPNFDFKKFGIGLNENNVAVQSHNKILQNLIEQIELLDFADLANVNDDENFKLGMKHFIVLSIENVLKLAKENQWGLCKKDDFIYLFNGSYWAAIDSDIFENFL